MSLEDDMIQLKVDKDNQPGTPDETSELSIFQSVQATAKKLKKDKKEKKKKKKAENNPLTKVMDSIIGDSDLIASMDDETPSLLDLAKDIRKSTKKKKGKLEFDKDEFLDADGKKRKGKKKSLAKYQESFKKEHALYMGLLKEADMDNKDFKKIFKELAGSKGVRGISKTLTDVMAAINSSNSNRLAITKALFDLNKTAHDMALKEDSKKKEVDGDSGIDQELFGAKMLANLFSKDNNSFTRELREQSAISEEEFEQFKQQAVPVEKLDNIAYSEEDEPQEEEKPAYVPDPDGFDETLAQRASELSGEYAEKNPLLVRPSTGDELIKYENRGIQIKIKRWLGEEDEWELIAVDSNGIEVPDYPKPNKKQISPVRFNDDTNTASDRFGRSYEVIDVAV